MTDTAPDREPSPTAEPIAATAEEVYRSYIDASNEVVYADAETYEAAAEFMSPRMYSSLSASWAAEHESGHVIGGKMTVAYFREKTGGLNLTVEATACLDLSDVTVVDRYGKSVLPEDSTRFLASYVEFTSVDGELLLDTQYVEPIAQCPVSGPKSEPVLPERGTPDTTAPDEPPRGQDENCNSFPGGVAICGG